MSEIPEGILKVVDELPLCGDGYPDNGDRETIARAIADERERAANIAQTHIPEGIHPDDLYRWRDTAGAIAAAIRTGN